MNNKYLAPMLAVFAGITVFAITGQTFLEKQGINASVLLGGNTVLFGASLVSFWFMSRGITGKNNNAFIRMVYAGFLSKFFICALAAAIYILAAKSAVNKPALYVVLPLYIVYTYFEVRGLMKLNRAQKNA
jgi:hypothetical protein